VPANCLINTLRERGVAPLTSAALGRSAVRETGPPEELIQEASTPHLDMNNYLLLSTPFHERLVPAVIIDE